MAQGRPTTSAGASPNLSNSAHSTPRLESSSHQSRTPPASPRPSSARNSIRRKPVPSLPGDAELSPGHGDAGEGEETLREQGGSTASAASAASAAMGRGDSTGSGSEYARSIPPSPSSASSRHAFPPQPRRTGSAIYLPQSSPNPYSPTTPGAMTAAARSRHPSTSRETIESTSFQPRLATRTSFHSQQSSVAPENVYGTAQSGVVGKNKPREVIRIERDYSEGELCQFWSGWIWELEGRISPTDFQNTFNELNTALASAHDPYKSCFDNCCAVLTFYVSPYILGSHYHREMAKFDRVLERANREIYNPAGLNLLHPKRNAFLFLEIEYY